MADKIIVVCTPELNTLRDVRECQRVFGEIIRLDMKRVCFVFNHNQPFAVLGREQFESALEQPMTARAAARRRGGLQGRQPRRAAGHEQRRRCRTARPSKSSSDCWSPPNPGRLKSAA